MTAPTAYGVTIDNVWNLRQPTHITQYAAFGEATYAITDQIKLTGGLREYRYQNVTNKHASLDNMIQMTLPSPEYNRVETKPAPDWSGWKSLKT